MLVWFSPDAKKKLVCNGYIQFVDVFYAFSQLPEIQNSQVGYFWACEYLSIVIFKIGIYTFVIIMKTAFFINADLKNHFFFGKEIYVIQLTTYLTTLYSSFEKW